MDDRYDHRRWWIPLLRHRKKPTSPAPRHASVPDALPDDPTLVIDLPTNIVLPKRRPSPDINPARRLRALAAAFERIPEPLIGRLGTRLERRTNDLLRDLERLLAQMPNAVLAPTHDYREYEEGERGDGKPCDYVV